MANPRLGAVLREIRRVAVTRADSGLTDLQLLEDFCARRDEAAFTALVRRYGPLVLGICRRVTGHLQDAEDALQATFLILARNAASIRKRESLSSWLHGVAYRMAAQARRAASRRHRNESRGTLVRPRDPALSAAWQELQMLLDEEIGRLPEILREPFVYCCLESRSSAEAARLLGIREGAVGMRLSRARQRLQQQLMRRGVSLTAMLAAVAIGANDCLASVPAALVLSTAPVATLVAAGQPVTAEIVSTNVAALTEGVFKAMFLTKLKTAALSVLVVGLVVAGALIAGLQALPTTALAAQPTIQEKGKTPGEFVTLLSAQAEKENPVTYVDLRPKANQKLNETFRAAAFQGNHLGELKQEKQTLEGLKFSIGEGLIYLANAKLKDELPEKVEGIKVDAKFAKLHILHATAYAAQDDTVIAKYVVHYADKSDETIEVVFGKDVRDWWYHDGDKEPTRGKVAWKGSNEPAKGLDCSLWLFSLTWSNPHPGKQVVSIDYVSTLSDAAPFVVAMTLEHVPSKDSK